MPDDQIFDADELKQELPPDAFQQPQPKPWYKNWKIFVSFFVALLVIGGIGWYFFWGQTPSAAPVSNNVTLLIKGPISISSGSEAEYHILYHNGENADLTNVSLNMIYPTNFVFKSSTPAPTNSSGITFNLPVIKEGRDGEVVIRGKLSGSTGEDKQIQAKLNYVLSNFNSDFSVSQSIHTSIAAPNLTFDISGPVEVPVGQSTTFTVNYSNVSNQDYDNVAISLVYPQDYSFKTASTPPSKSNNYWTIGKLLKGANGHIDVTGDFMGQSMDQQMVMGQLGIVINNSFAPQISSTASFSLKSAPIAITQTADPADVVSLGGEVQYIINYSNEGEIGLTNLIITDTISSNLIDVSRLSVPDAVITGNVITWKSATNTNLSILPPGGRGQVQFTLPLKQSLPVTLTNQVIKNSVQVVSSEITTPIQAADTNVKLATNFSFSMTGDYISGAMPMQVGKSTVFAINYQLTNSSNDLNNVLIDASLPLPPSAWKNVIIPSSESSRLTYDPGSGHIKWNVGNLPAFTGKLTPALKVSFQLVVTPGPSDQGQQMRLLTNIAATATDSFTNQNLAPNPIPQFSTGDIDDQIVQDKGSTVQ